MVKVQTVYIVYVQYHDIKNMLFNAVSKLWNYLIYMYKILCLTETSIILAIDLAFEKPAKFQYCHTIIKTILEENPKFKIRVNYFIN